MPKESEKLKSKLLQVVMDEYSNKLIPVREANQFLLSIKDTTERALQEIKQESKKSEERLQASFDKAIDSLKNTEKSLNEANKQSQAVTKEIKPLIRQAFREIDDIKNNMPETPDLSPYLTVEKLKEFLPEMPDTSDHITEEEAKKLIPDAKKLADELEERLTQKVNELDQRTAKAFSDMPRGGGTSSIGVAQSFKWIAHTEQPVGDIDGANTTYTVENNIWWIAGFTLNGEQIAELPNFTYVNKTITFSTPLPAAFSGKDFEVKYIGT